MTRVSVAMATYNGEAYLLEQLESVASQTRPPDQLVICDDASSDRTVDIVERFANSAPFTVDIHRNVRNLGYSQNFGRAISLCDGDIIFLSDQDDVWFVDKIARVAAELEQEGVVASVNDQRIVSADKTDSGETIFSNSRRAGFPDTHLIAGSCTAFVRPLADVILPIPNEIPYDSWIGAIADALAAKALIEEPLQLFRRHDRNASAPDVVRTTSRWRHALYYRSADRMGAWLQEIAWRSTMNERLQESGDGLRERVSGGAIAAAIDRNERRIAALSARSELVRRPRIGRAWPIVRAWRSGTYDEFNGARSALGDLVRR